MLQALSFWSRTGVLCGDGQAVAGLLNDGASGRFRGCGSIVCIYGGPEAFRFEVQPLQLPSGSARSRQVGQTSADSLVPPRLRAHLRYDPPNFRLGPDMAERTIDGHRVWTGAEMTGDGPGWVPTIIVKAPDGLLEIHSLGDRAYSGSGQAEQYADERLALVVGIGPELELEFAKDQAVSY